MREYKRREFLGLATAGLALAGCGKSEGLEKTVKEHEITVLKTNHEDWQDEAEDVRATVVDLYSALNAGDADAFVQYMLPGGYTEFTSSGRPLSKIDEKYVRRVFDAGYKADYEVRELEVKVFKDAAVVTGYRVGTLTMPDGATRENILCLSMMWFRQGGKWRLAHVHLSPSNP